jgi:excisionase family DNA binding protein
VKKTKMPVTFQEALKITGYSRNWLYQLCERGEVPHIRVGGRLLFDEVELRNWTKRTRQ